MTILNLQNVTCSLGTNRKILDSIDYQIERADFVILLGSNGSGKSTLLKLLHRHHQPDNGEIEFLQKPLQQYSEKHFQRKVAVLTQNCDDSLFTSLTVYENYRLIQQNKSDASVCANYLAEFNQNLAGKLNTIVSHLSGGEKQALALALCLLHPPELLLLDEHTSALDPKTSQQIMRLTQSKIKQYGITCVLTTHDLDIALEYGNRALILREGRVHNAIDAERKQRLTKAELMEHYL